MEPFHHFIVFMQNAEVSAPHQGDAVSRDWITLNAETIRTEEGFRARKHANCIVRVWDECTHVREDRLNDDGEFAFTKTAGHHNCGFQAIRINRLRRYVKRVPRYTQTHIYINIYRNICSNRFSHSSISWLKWSADHWPTSNGKIQR